jgi:hypothetical protein
VFQFDPAGVRAGLERRQMEDRVGIARFGELDALCVHQLSVEVEGGLGGGPGGALKRDRCGQSRHVAFQEKFGRDADLADGQVGRNGRRAVADEKSRVAGGLEGGADVVPGARPAGVPPNAVNQVRLRTVF